MSDNIKNIAVAGAGTMGAGIAQVFAQAGYSVLLFDVATMQLDRAKAEISRNLQGAVTKGKMTEAAMADTIARISYDSDFHSLKADLFIEAIVEKLEIKKDLFQKVAAINPPDTILASNTSSLSITQIAKDIAHPERVVGMHFFNPAHLMKLVEVISGAESSAEVAEQVRKITLEIGKSPVMAKDSPGFIVNRVARHYYVESLKALEERVTSQENVDALLESAGFKMGPFKLMDTIGNDVNYAVTSSLYAAFHQDPKFRPSRIQQQKVDAGHLGKKTGRGFYEYK